MQSDGTDKLIKINSLARVAAVMSGVLVIQILLQVVFEIIINALSGQSVLMSEPAAVYHIFYGLSAGLAALFIYNTYYRGEPESFYGTALKRGHFQKCVKRAVILVLFGLAMQLLAYSVLSMAYLFAVDSPLFKSYSELSDRLSGNTTHLIFFYTLLLAPFAEEYIFRGLIYGSARKGFGSAAANIIQAFLFALYHGNLIQGIYAFVLGLLLGYAAEHKKCMPEIVGMHMVVNISGIFVIPAFMNILCGVMDSRLSYIIGTAVSLACIAWIIITYFEERKYSKNQA